PAAAWPRARRRHARELRPGARAARQHDQPRRPDAHQPAACGGDVDDDTLIFNAEFAGWAKARSKYASASTRTLQRHAHHSAIWRSHVMVGAALATYFFSPPFLLLSSTFRSGLDFVALASRSIRYFGVA